jgi:hypothetical protein
MLFEEISATCTTRRTSRLVLEQALSAQQYRRHLAVHQGPQVAVIRQLQVGLLIGGFGRRQLKS